MLQSRHRMLKSLKDLQQLPANSQDVYKRNVIDRYTERPTEMENFCLADFASLYNFKSKKTTPSDEADLDLNELAENGDNGNNESNSNSKTIKLSDGILTRRRNPKILRFCRFNLTKDPINFYRERLMLFLPWRNEMEELEKIDVEQKFNEYHALIKLNSDKYIKEDIDFDAIASELQNSRAEDDDVEVENDRHEEEQALNDASFVNVFEFPDNTMQADVMSNICDESEVPAAPGVEFNKITVPELFSNEEYYKLMVSLNVKQQDYLMHVLNAVKCNEKPFYHFIGGEAGVGKSRLITALYQTLLRHFRKELGSVESLHVLICAYTGKAAHNVGGVTAHNAFLLPIKNFVDGAVYRLTPEKLNNLRVKFAKLKIIIIDEISLFGRRTFEKLNERLKEIYQTEKLFGGLTIIVLGHFGQLRPVKDDYIYANGGSGMQRLVGNCLWEPFLYFELTEIMRQKDDVKFAEALGRLAIGNMTSDDTAMFQRRSYTESSLPEEGKSAVRLMWRNDEVFDHNRKRLEELQTENCIRITYTARDTIVGALSQQEKSRIQHNLQGLPAQKTQGLAKEIILQTGIRYMVTTNIDVSDGLFNGATGVLKFIEFTNGQPEILFLEFENQSIGKSARAQKQSFYRINSNVNKKWTPLSRTKSSFKVSQKGTGQVKRKKMHKNYPDK